MNKGDKLMRIGSALLVVGMIFTLVAITPLFVPSVHLPSFMWALSMITGLGLALVILGLRQSGQVRRNLK